jgi:tape measure domain-containing protein
MAGNIKGITIEIDGNTTKLQSALKDVDGATKSVNSELKQVDGLLKFNPGSTELLAQKQELLAKQVQNTESRLKTLKSAQAQVEAQFKSGDMGEEEYRAFQRELTATEGKLNSYKGQLKSAQSAQSEYGSATNRLNGILAATGKDVTQFETILGGKLTSAIREGTASTSQLNTAFSKIASASGVARSDVGELAESFSKFDGSANGVKSVTSSLDAMKEKAQTSTSVISSFKEKLSFGAVTGLAQQGLSTLTGGMGEMVSQAADASDALDKFKSTMGFAGYDSGTIKKAGADVKSYADKTVYDLSTVSNTTAQLASNGVKDFTGLTEASGNLNAVAGGNADTFRSVAMVLTQTVGAGKLTTENWNQLADAIPGASGKLQEAMKKNGAYTGNFRDAMEKGEISSNEFTKAITDLGNTDGAKKAAESTSTFEGAIGNLQANVVSGIQKIIDQIGKANLANMISTISNGIVGALQKVVSVLQFVGQHADAFKVLGTAIAAVILVIKTATTVQSLFNVTMLANPIVAVVAAIGILVAAIVAFFTQTKAGQQAWQTFMDWLKTAWNGIKTFFTGLWNAIVQIFTTAVTAIKTAMTTAWTAITTVTSTVWNGIKTFFTALWDGIKAVFTVVIQAIIAYVTAEWNAIKLVTTTVFNAVKSVVSAVWNGIKIVFTTVVGAISSAVSAAWNVIKSATSTIFNTVSSIVSSVWNGIKSVVSGVVNGVKSVVSGAWNGIKSVTSSVFNAVKSVVSSVWNGIKSTVSGAVNGVKSTVSSVWNAIKSVTSSAWNGIKSAISGPINAAKDAVARGISAIKSLFNFHISWPHIPLPHFSISGKFNPLKGQIPHIGVSWYAKGGIMTKPTMFASNGNNISVGGEAGPEAVLPLNAKTLAGIGAGIAEQMDGGTINVTVQVMADTTPQTIKKIQTAVVDGITKAQNARSRAVGGA